MIRSTYQSNFEESPNFVSKNQNSNINRKSKEMSKILLSTSPNKNNSNSCNQSSEYKKEMKRLRSSILQSNDEDSSSSEKKIPRKSKELCKKLMSNSLNIFSSDSDDYQISEYDSDADPEFKFTDPEEEADEINESSNNNSNAEEEREENDDSSNNNSSDSDNESIISNFTDFNETFDMLTRVLNNETLPSKKCDITSADELMEKHMSKRKISDECKGIYGAAEQNFWDQNYDEAQNQCAGIIKEFPSFWGAYELLGRIYERKGDVKKANQFFYTSVMCDPKSTEKWITCIENTMYHEGVEKAIEMAKLAMSRCNTKEIRELLADLLEKGGYEKEALKRKLANFEMGAREENPTVINEIVKELFNMSEKFNAEKDIKRSCKCLEIINLKYPTFVTDEQRFCLLKQMFSVKRFQGIFGVIKNITGVDVDFNCPANLIRFTEEISDENRKFIIFCSLLAAIQLEMIVFVETQLFYNLAKEIVDNYEWFLIISNKLYDMKHYQVALDLLEYIIEQTDNKLDPSKLYGKCQEALGMDNDALCTYDNIISNISVQDASIWELKANLLYRMKREDDAIVVLAESQKFIYVSLPGNELVNRCKPTRDSLQLLNKLCNLLYKEKRIDEFIKVSWKFLFIDSYEFFNVNKVDLCCEDIVFAKANISEIQNSIWLCIPKALDGNGHCVFPTTHLKMGDETTWNILKKLMNLFAKSEEIYSELLELLSQWGLVLQKILNWNSNIRLKLSVIYVSTAIRNRIKNHRLRLDVSSNMIFQEIRILKTKFGENAQFWNLYHIYTNLIGTYNDRFVLRNMPTVKNIYPLEIINSGYILTGFAKLSLAINSKLFMEHRENPLFSLHMAITLVNSSLSRNCRENTKPMLLAVAFLNEYRRLRGDCQETYYNIGRFYHKINFENNAIAYYEKCLMCPPVGNTNYERSLTDLTKEAAFNLVYIYKSRNEKHKAASITRRYLII